MMQLSFNSHCVIGLFIRFVFISYANFHDKFFEVPYTDVDYKVFSDAARLVTEGRSPFERHTYRYSPILAILLTPNEYFLSDFGKVLFCLVDVFVAIIIKRILVNNETANLCAYLWLYNPLTIIISTRGNADSISAFLVLSTVLALQKNHCIIAGLIHGLSVHFRLYPLMFSLTFYLSLRTKDYLFPNLNQLKLTLSCVFALISLTSIFYFFYGYEFLYESLLYHLVRKDSKHNFSVYFYMFYLSAEAAPSLVERICTFLPQLLALIATSIRLGNKHTLTLGLFLQAMIMVTYNPVMTCQYYFWFLSLMPVCLPFITMTSKRAFVLLNLWIISQVLWLILAYFLEFQGINTFVGLWIASLAFFVVNVKIIVDFSTYVKFKRCYTD